MINNDYNNDVSVNQHQHDTNRNVSDTQHWNQLNYNSNLVDNQSIITINIKVGVVKNDSEGGGSTVDTTTTLTQI